MSVALHQWIEVKSKSTMKHYLLHKVDEQVPHIFGVCEFGCDVDQRPGQIL